MRESKKGFTLIEMIFVIAVTGVIAGMTFIQISQIYESLIQKNYSSEIQNEASIVSEQIVSRLSGAFKESLAMTNKLGGQCIGLADLNTSMADGVLMWVAKSEINIINGTCSLMAFNFGKFQVLRIRCNVLQCRKVIIAVFQLNQLGLLQ